ncbi:MAG: hypothetical protein WEB87_04835 [Bacteriovoracaceae bacterium]
MSEEKNSSKVYTRKWSNFLIFPRFQMVLLFINLFILSGSVGIVVFQIKKSWDVFNSFAIQQNLVHNQSFLELVAEQESNFFMTLWLAAVLSLVFCSLFTVVFSHKVVGSMHRLKSYFQDVAENGHKRELTFREGDLHKEVPDIVNAAIKRIKEDEGASSSASQKDIS